MTTDSDPPQVPAREPPSRPEKKRRRMSRHVVPMMFLVAILALSGLFLSLGGPTPQDETSIQATSAEITVVAVTAKIQDKEINRGFKILTPGWVIVTDIGTLQQPDQRNGSISNRQLMASKNLASVCELARQENQPVTFIGSPAKDTQSDGKPLLVARAVVYRGKEILLTVKD
jgi:hypothetical protein